jgi:small subunit ribosomal protein S6
MDLKQRKNTYELVVITKPEIPEDKQNAILGKVEDVIKKFEGEILEFDSWGKKRLAYVIKKEVKGNYFYWSFKSLPSAISEVERTLKLNDDVMRFLTIKLTPQDLEKMKEMSIRNSEEESEKSREAQV